MRETYALLQLLLRSKLVRVAALLLSAVRRPWGKSGVALSANHLVAVVLSGQHLQGRLNCSSTKAKNQVKGGLLLDIVVRQSPAVLKLLSSEDQALLIRGDPFLILNLSLDIIDAVRGFDIEGNRLTRQGLHEDLHGKETELVTGSNKQRLPNFIKYKK